MTNFRPILVVDDNPHLVDILNRAARHTFEQARFIAVQTLEQAIAYLDGLRGPGPCLVLLDIDLHGFRSGLDFLTSLRQHPQGRLLPVVILSANLTTANMDSAYRQGASALTTKPNSYQGWKSYVHELRVYWFETVTLPRLWFEAADNANEESTPRQATSRRSDA